MNLLELISRWRRRRHHLTATSAGGLFTTIVRPDGSRMVVDQATLEYMKSTAPQPTQASLDAVLDQVERIRLFANGAHNNSLNGPPVLLLESTDREAMSALGNALRIVEGPSGHCMCYGGPTLELLGSSDRRLALLAVHHGQSIRWTAWKDDARLVDRSKLVAWLAARGVTSEKAEHPEGTDGEGRSGRTTR